MSILLSTFPLVIICSGVAISIGITAIYFQSFRLTSYWYALGSTVPVAFSQGSHLPFSEINKTALTDTSGAVER